jgi:hypothetical protein
MKEQKDHTKPEAAEDQAVGVDALVSLRITDDTKLGRKAIMFGDGEDGYFMQQHQIFADDHDTGVTMLVTGNLGKDNTTRTFEFGGQDFEKIQDAFRAAGHDVVSSN